MDAYSDIAYDVTDRIATITLNRPQARNGYTTRMSDELADVFVRADRDDDVRVVIFTGAGDDFCVGADLSAGFDAFDVDDGWQEPAGRCVKPIFALSKPVIAAIRGAAVGVGSTVLPAARDLDSRLTALAPLAIAPIVQPSAV